tara:strand:- start:301 stop:735 length:435 start_codon:yes stop_codon:yes gene_type:complete
MFKILKGLRKDKSHLLLAVLLVCFIVLDVQLPAELVYHVDTLLGRVFIIIGAFSLFFVNPVLGVLAMVGAFVLLSRASNNSNSSNIKYLSSEKKKFNQLSKLNRFPFSLEEEMVFKSTPFVAKQFLPAASYKATLESTHEALKI